MANTKSWEVIGKTVRIYLVNNEATDESQGSLDKAADVITLIGGVGDAVLQEVLSHVSALMIYRSTGTVGGTPCTAVNVQKLVGTLWHTFATGNDLATAASTIYDEVSIGSPSGAKDVRIQAVDNSLDGTAKFAKVTTAATVICLTGQLDYRSLIGDIASTTPAIV